MKDRHSLPQSYLQQELSCFSILFHQRNPCFNFYLKTSIIWHFRISYWPGLIMALPFFSGKEESASLGTTKLYLLSATTLPPVTCLLQNQDTQMMAASCFPSGCKHTQQGTFQSLALDTQSPQDRASVSSLAVSRQGPHHTSVVSTALLAQAHRHTPWSLHSLPCGWH